MRRRVKSEPTAKLLVEPHVLKKTTGAATKSGAEPRWPFPIAVEEPSQGTMPQGLELIGLQEEDLLGAHIVSPRVGYSHHGIYVGSGFVVHYSGLANGIESGPVEEVSVSLFASGSDVYLCQHADAAFKRHEIVNRARSRIGENLYDVFSNNCEHFCMWCVTGNHHSSQVDNGTAVTTTGSASITGLVARGAISIGGSVAGVSGAGVMSGLASAGACVGGGAVAGIGLLAGAPALGMASLINNTVLKDNPAHSFSERDARATGRVSTYVGAGAGVAGSIATISASGAVAGLSGAGITSGLAAIGATVGGGMATGVVMATAAPVAAAALVGVGVYKIVKWIKN